MKLLEQFFEFINSEFEKRKTLAPFVPLKDATEAFFLGTSRRAGKAPYIRDHIDLKRYMFMVVLALAPLTVFGIFIYGLRVLLVIAVSYIFGGLVEVVFAIVRKHEINEGFLVTGLIFPLTLPPTVPLWMVALGIVFGVAVGKELFGGTGNNIFNPALVARCFIYLSYPSAMTSGWVVPGNNLFNYIDSSSVDVITKATPLSLYKSGVVTDNLQLLLGTTSGSIGETSAILIILSGIFLVVTGIANFRTPIAAIIGGALTSFIFVKFGVLNAHPPVFTLLSGGYLFGVFFMATDPVSAPSLNEAKWVCGFLLGVLIVLIRTFSGYYEGVMFAILIANLMAPLLDHIVLNIRYGSFKGGR